MGHGRSSLSPRRPTIGRKVRPSILIVCEGEKTEPTYFRWLASRLRQVAQIEVDIEVEQSSEGTSPDHVVEGAILRREERSKKSKKSNAHMPYNAVWAVFDTESRGHPFFAKAPTAMAEARSHGILVAVSRPCFEVWFILHFKNNPPAADCYEDAERAINDIFANEGVPIKYKKKGKRGNEALSFLFKLLDQRTGAAIRNALKLEERIFSSDPYAMPNMQGTRVHQLILSLLPQDIQSDLAKKGTMDIFLQISNPSTLGSDG